MRGTEPDKPEGLGKKIEKPVMPEQHIKVSEGVYRKPDGTIYTSIPANEAASTANPWRNWPFYVGKPVIGEVLTDAQRKAIADGTTNAP